MSITIRTELYDPRNESHLDYADTLHALQQVEGSNMLVLNREELESHELGVLGIADIEGEDKLVGYNAVTKNYDDTFIEIGGLFVPERYRGMGVVDQIKARLFSEARQRYAGKVALVFANSHSLELNLRYGFEPASCVPRVALDVCKTSCPSYKKLFPDLDDQCCDTILSRPVDLLKARSE